MPSLVSIPLLGYRDYNPQVYAATRKRLLSTQTNSYYFQGKEFKVRQSPWLCFGFALLPLHPSATSHVWGRCPGCSGVMSRSYWFDAPVCCTSAALVQGMGSPHTSHGMAWALGIFSEVRYSALSHS